MHSQFVFVHHSCHYVAHFRIARSLDLYLRQQVLTCYVSDIDFVALTFVAGDISTPEDFLKAIGRSSETKISFDTWDGLWKTNGQALKKAGLATRDRRYVAFAETIGLMSDSLDRYILWAMEHYRQGDYPSDYAHETKPRKTVRGCASSPLAQVGRSGRTLNSHGPAVQFGKRIRSRRHK